ncbi:MAG TPA: hypothetical protein PLP33_25935 [Leptospiraceae bacterium]|nr:hypothetical protein [Leptospiraceae bacterium]
MTEIALINKKQKVIVSKLLREPEQAPDGYYRRGKFYYYYKKVTNDNKVVLYFIENGEQRNSQVKKF